MNAKIATLTADLATASTNVDKLTALSAAQTAKIVSLGGDIATLKDQNDSLTAQLAAAGLSAEDNAALDAADASTKGITQKTLDALAANSLT